MATDFYKPYCTYDIRVPLSDGSQSISMIPNILGQPDDLVIIYADPEKLKSIVGHENRNRSPNYLMEKIMGSWLSIFEARIDERNGQSEPAPSAYFESMHVPKMNFLGPPYVRGNKAVINDGVSRTTNLILQKAQFIPVQTSFREADLGHRLVGFNHISPIPVTQLVVPDEKQKEYLAAHYEIVRNCKEIREARREKAINAQREAFQNISIVDLLL